jgi:hypothetical protein
VRAKYDCIEGVLEDPAKRELKVGGDIPHLERINYLWIFTHKSKKDEEEKDEIEKR